MVSANRKNQTRSQKTRARISKDQLSSCSKRKESAHHELLNARVKELKGPIIPEEIEKVKVYIAVLK
ncbi:MAG: hypothetical protein ACFFAK_16675 [Promethearchaeota archaeon]